MRILAALLPLLLAACTTVSIQMQPDGSASTTATAATVKQARNEARTAARAYCKARNQAVTPLDEYAASAAAKQKSFTFIFTCAAPIADEFEAIENKTRLTPNH